MDGGRLGLNEKKRLRPSFDDWMVVFGLSRFSRAQRVVATDDLVDNQIYCFRIDNANQN